MFYVVDMCDGAVTIFKSENKRTQATARGTEKRQMNTFMNRNTISASYSIHPLVITQALKKDKRHVTQFKHKDQKMDDKMYL